ncbi:AMP-binding protein [Nocardiopsis salina]|uniref:AMP-binding protein n=1 Tax=Nocardiopsis salina TaxID=245836 RepID=UPI00034805BC|nr:AMP-binding protein [Nocardiopsis salina]
MALILACLLDGRPFLLLPTGLPDAQSADLAAQAGCRAVFDPEGEPLAAPPLDDVPTEPLPSGTTFMLTTSGSTGRPKVVPLSGDAVAAFAAWAGPAFGLCPGVGVLNYAPLNFDLCLFDIWSSLAYGARVVLVGPKQAIRGSALLDLVLEHEVSVVQAVPMAYRLLLDAAHERGTVLRSVRHAVFTGDTMPEHTLSGMSALLPEARMYNVYGCTETNDSFMHEYTAEEGAGGGDDPAGPSIGTPLPGVGAMVLDGRGERVEGPGSGELYVSTPFQSEGYLDPARREGVFTGHPLGSDERRWYRTGDLVRRDAYGRLRLVGRADHQVKVRGVAVNTAEVERVLLAHPDVLEAGVAALPDTVAGRRLAAGVRRAPGTGLNSLTLRAYCAQYLSRAAVPGSFRITDDALPTTSTGKIDRTALGATPAGAHKTVTT